MQQIMSSEIWKSDYPGVVKYVHRYYYNAKQKEKRCSTADNIQSCGFKKENLREHTTVTCLDEIYIPLFQSEFRKGNTGAEPLDTVQPAKSEIQNE